MNFLPRKRAICLVGAASALAGFALFWPGLAAPTLEFKGFRRDSGILVADFRIRNDSSRVFRCAAYPNWKGTVQFNALYRFKPTGREPIERLDGSGAKYWSYRFELEPSQAIEFTVPLDFESGEFVTGPFQVGVQCWRMPPPFVATLSARLSRWIPPKWTEPDELVAWSDAAPAPDWNAP